MIASCSGEAHIAGAKKRAGSVVGRSSTSRAEAHRDRTSSRRTTSSKQSVFASGRRRDIAAGVCFGRPPPPVRFQRTAPSGDRWRRALVGARRHLRSAGASTSRQGADWPGRVRFAVERRSAIPRPPGSGTGYGWLRKPRYARHRGACPGDPAHPEAYPPGTCGRSPAAGRTPGRAAQNLEHARIIGAVLSEFFLLGGKPTRCRP